MPLLPRFATRARGINAPLLEIKGLLMPMSGEGGGSVDDCTSDTYGAGGGGSMDEEAHMRRRRGRMRRRKVDG